MMRGLPLPGPFRIRHGRHQSAGTVTVDSEPDTGIPIHRMPRLGTQGPVPQAFQLHVRSRSKGQRGTGTGNDDHLIRGDQLPRSPQRRLSPHKENKNSHSNDGNNYQQDFHGSSRALGRPEPYVRRKHVNRIHDGAKALSRRGSDPGREPATADLTP